MGCEATKIDRPFAIMDLLENAKKTNPKYWKLKCIESNVEVCYKVTSIHLGDWENTLDSTLPQYRDPNKKLSRVEMRNKTIDQRLMARHILGNAGVVCSGRRRRKHNRHR